MPHGRQSPPPPRRRCGSSRRYGGPGERHGDPGRPEHVEREQSYMQGIEVVVGKREELVHVRG